MAAAAAVALAPTSTSSSAILVQELLLAQFHSRKLLLHHGQNPSLYPIQDSATSPTGTSHDGQGDNSFDSNVVMVLSVLLCALICSLGLNSIIKCALRCSTIVSPSASSSSSSSSSSASARLANTGIKKKALKTFPTITYAPDDLKLPGMDTECVICLTDFSAGDKVRVLPKCNHGFHVRCIDKWLNSHSSCPTCRHCLIETCQKIVGCSSTSTTPPLTASVVPPPPPPPPAQTARPQETIVRIAPLEPEGLVRSYES